MRETVSRLSTLEVIALMPVVCAADVELHVIDVHQGDCPRVHVNARRNA